MFETVVLSTDASDSARAMYPLLPDLREMGMENLVLVNVADADFSTGPDSPQRLNRVRKRLRGEARRLQADDLSPVTEARYGYPAGEITAVASEHDADLIMIANQGRGRIREFLLGSTAADTIRLSKNPVFLVRVNGDEPSLVNDNPFRRPLLASDHSTSVRGAERLTLDLSEHSECLDVVSVVDVGETEERIRELRKEWDRRLEKRLKPVRDRGIPVRTYVDQGVASENIMNRARDCDSTVIVAGKRGRGRIRDLLLGSTVNELARRWERHLLVVP